MPFPGGYSALSPPSSSTAALVLPPDLAVVFLSPKKLAPLGGVPLTVCRDGGAFESRHPVQEGCHKLASGPPNRFLSCILLRDCATAIQKKPVCPRPGIESLKLRVHGCSLPSRKRPPLSACRDLWEARRPRAGAAFPSPSEFC